jgi:hypothetical protein
VKRAVLLVATIGCGLPEPTEEGEHVRVAMDPGLSLCGDGVGHMDAFTALVAAELDVAAPTGDDRIVFHWLHPADFESRTICINDNGGCAWHNDIYATTAPLDHEIVHSLGWAYGTPPVFFIEGLAVAYELPPPDRSDGLIPATNVLDVAAGTGDLWLPGELYPLAGAFVGFLIERHGIAAVLRVYERLRLADGRRRITRIFEQELGESLEQAAAAFDLTRGVCSPRAWRRKLFECAAPEIAWDGASWSEFRTLDCDQEDVVGPFFGHVALYHTLEVPETGVYEVAMIGDAGPGSDDAWNAVQLMRCGACEGYTEVDLIGASDRQVAELPAGRYSLRRTGPAQQASGIGVRIERVGPATSP